MCCSVAEEPSLARLPLARCTPQDMLLLLLPLHQQIHEFWSPHQGLRTLSGVSSGVLGNDFLFRAVVDSTIQSVVSILLESEQRADSCRRLWRCVGKVMHRASK